MISSVLSTWLLYNYGSDGSISLVSIFFTLPCRIRVNLANRKKNIFHPEHYFSCTVSATLEPRYLGNSRKREKDEGRKFKQPNSWNTNARTIRDLLVRLCCLGIHEPTRPTKKRGTRKIWRAGNIVSDRSWKEFFLSIYGRWCPVSLLN